MRIYGGGAGGDLHISRNKIYRLASDPPPPTDEIFKNRISTLIANAGSRRIYGLQRANALNLGERISSPLN